MDNMITLEEKLDVISSQEAYGRERKRNFQKMLDYNNPLFKPVRSPVGSHIIDKLQSVIESNAKEDQEVSKAIEKLEHDLFRANKQAKLAEQANSKSAQLLSETPSVQKSNSETKDVVKKVTFKLPEEKTSSKSEAEDAIKTPIKATSRNKPETARNLQIKSFDSLLEEVITMRKNFADRAPLVAAFSSDKKFQKFLNQVKSQIGMVGETVSSLLNKYYGTSKIMGPKSFIDKAEEVIPQKLDLVFHVIAKHILSVASGVKIRPLSMIKSPREHNSERGESLCSFKSLFEDGMLSRPRFYDILQEALYSMNPYSFPGLRDYIEKQNYSKEERLVALGFLKDESSSTYLSRMQGLAAFQAAFYQTPMRWLYGYPFDDGFVKTGSKHPCQYGGHVESWRFIAGHLNHTVWRWTPYILQAFIAVCGYELCKNIGEEPMFKLIKVLNSEDFLTRCKNVGSFSAKDTQNDIDRYQAFVDAFQEKIVSHTQGAPLFRPPGDDEEEDARILVLENTTNTG